MSNKTVYLVAIHSMKPKQRVRTNQKGWNQNPNNVTYDESVSLTKVLKNKDIAYGTIILDLGKRQVIRNRWDDNRTFDNLFDHFYKGYQKDLDPVIKQFGYTVEMGWIKDIDTVTNVQVIPDTPTVEVVAKSETISSV